MTYLIGLGVIVVFLAIFWRLEEVVSLVIGTALFCFLIDAFVTICRVLGEAVLGWWG